MRSMKKVASLALALVLCLSLSVGVWADGPTTYTITISNNVSGYTYAAYQIFTGDLSGAATDDNVAGTQAVLSNIQWGNDITPATFITQLKAKFTGEGNKAIQDLTASSSAATVAEALKGKDAKTIAECAAASLKENVSGTTSTFITDQTRKHYTISGLKPGYYLVKNTAVPSGQTDTFYTNYILEVVENSTVSPKGTVPTVDKTVEDNDVVTPADYNIGDHVPFTLTGTLPNTFADYEKYTIYTFHDTLSAGLTYDNSSAKVYFVNGETNTSADDCFDVTINGQNLTVQLKSGKDLKTNQSVNANTKIVVKYTATLNASAEIGESGNKNEVYLEYSNNPNWDGNGTAPSGETIKDEVLVFTYELDVTKTDGTNKLKDVEFVLYREVKKTVEGEQKTVNEYVQVDTNSKVTGWTETKSAASTLTSDVNGVFKVIGLDAGEYYLEETKELEGFNKLEKPVKIVIEATTENDSDNKSATLKTLTIKVDDGEATNGVTATGIVSTTVVNQAGATLPETGGTGTTIFYVVGGMLAVLAAVLLITRKRMGAEN